MKHVIKSITDHGGFYLGGSRRMAEKYPDLIKVNNETDYDFYCDFDENKILYIESLGFVRRKSSDNPMYWDDLFIEIYDYENIQVIIRKDSKLYQQCFESISAYQYYRYLWKSSPQPYYANITQLRIMCAEYFNEMFDFYKNNKLTDTIKTDDTPW